ncbi:Hypothetical_protein [Hexamita inflata]|uniref:Hypothetical_protein n=1 Tax=Hexamita inflata TaxID=28002 RepID=A0AA86RRU5_9EUKA|nr:Hypothetical protein HINF_LOCUS66128 [Hexamita inflata]
MDLTAAKTGGLRLGGNTKSWLQADFLIIIYQLQTNNKQFPYDAKLLNLLKEMIVFYNQIKPQIEKQLVQYGFGILGRHKINANQMNSLVSFLCKALIVIICWRKSIMLQLILRKLMKA